MNFSTLFNTNLSRKKYECILLIHLLVTFGWGFIIYLSIIVGIFICVKIISSVIGILLGQAVITCKYFAFHVIGFLFDQAMIAYEFLVYTGIIAYVIDLKILEIFVTGVALGCVYEIGRKYIALYYH